MSIVTLALRNGEDELVATISRSFDDADIDVLRQFVAAMARVRNKQLLLRGLPAITNMNWSSEGLLFTC